jgi:transcriptional regulator with XRE-family HTH domain
MNKNNIEKTANSRIKEVRKYFKLTQADFANKVGLAHSQRIIEMEKNIKPVSHSVITKLVDEFGVNMDWLLRGKGSMIWDEEKADLQNIIKEEDTPSVISDKEMLMDELKKIKESIKALEAKIKKR